MKFRPCIDLHDGKVKQIVGMTLDNNENPVTNFESDKSSSWFAELYKKDNLKGGHVIMLGKGNEIAAKQALNSYPGGLQIGGGITSDNAKEFLDAGASQIIVTSYVFKAGAINWDNLKILTNLIGKDKIVLDLSCRIRNNKYYIVTDRWQTFTEVVINRENIDSLGKHCAEFLIHASDVEGMIQGIDIALIKLLENIINIPSTYAGGVRNIDDLKLINKTGKGKIDATVGSALDIFGGNLSYKEVVRWHKKMNPLG